MIVKVKKIKENIRNGLVCLGAISVAVISTSIGNKMVDNISGRILPYIRENIQTDDNHVAVDGKTSNIEVVKTPKNLYALSAALLDAESGRVLYEKDGYSIRANASTTKILTCILAIESGKLDEVVTISKYAASMPDVQLNVKAGEQYILEDLLYSLMLESHNDVAVAIAEHISGSVDEFSKLMNEKAKEIGCESTYFITPNGLDATAMQDGVEIIHGTTAIELARIMNYCIKNKKFVDITQTQSHTFNNVQIANDNSMTKGKKSYTVTNKNAFLTMMDGVISGKTGYTNDAGYCYVCSVENEGRKYTVALLGCGWPNNKTYKWVDTRKLIGYGVDYYQEKDVFDYNMNFNSIQVDDGVVGNYNDYGLYGINADKKTDVSVNIVEAPLNILCREDETVKREICIMTRLKAPVKKGDTVGYVNYTIEDELIGRYILYAAEDVGKKDFSWAWRCILNKFLLD